MDNIDIIFDELKRNEIDVDKQTVLLHINTINQHRDLYHEINTRGLNLEQVYREINVPNFGCITRAWALKSGAWLCGHKFAQ
jgi:hypothetical protein